MQTYQQTQIYLPRESDTNAFFVNRFVKWCTSQENVRFGWTAAIIAAMSCIMTPLTTLAVVTNGNSVLLFSLAGAAMVMSIVVNLAALPTRITIPVFVLSVLIDLGVLGMCIYAA